MILKRVLLYTSIPVPMAVSTKTTLEELAVHKKQPPGETTIVGPRIFQCLFDRREFLWSKDMPPGTVDD